MSDHAPVVLTGAPPARAAPPAPPGDVASLVPVLLIAGLVLSFAGWVDVALFYWPLRFGDAEWEFGTISQTFDALPLPTMGAVLLAMAARLTGRPQAKVALAVLCAAIAVWCLTLLIVFLLDVPVAFQALDRATRAAAEQGRQVNPLAGAGLKRGVAKAIVFGIAYAAAYLALAVLLLRKPRAGA